MFQKINIHLFALFCFCLFSFTKNTYAVQTEIFSTQKITAKPQGQVFQNNLNIANINLTSHLNATVFITNGNGTDLVIKNCHVLSMFQKLFCNIENAATNAYAKITRPKKIKVQVGAQTTEIINQQLQGHFALPFHFESQNHFKIEVKGLPTSSITFKINAEIVQNNNPPLAQFIFNATDFIEPSFVSFSALTSSDSDGYIASYDWVFGDEQIGQGALVNHIYETAGSYVVTLKVTDNLGATHLKTQTITIQNDTTGPVLSQFLPVQNSEVQGTEFIFKAQSNEPLLSATVQIGTTAPVPATISQNKLLLGAGLQFLQRGL